jgi:SRSO17 transposase
VGTQSAPGPQEKRFAAYTDGLAKAAGHGDRSGPLKAYCTGLLLPSERKSVEPMAACLAPDNVRRVHQSLHHLVADAPWSDEALLATVRGSVLPGMKESGPVVARVIEDTGFVKKGTHSVGVARQYSGQVGKQENCRVAVSSSVATHHASLPIAWRLYLPESWAHDRQRRKQARVPAEITFQTKPAIALEQIRQAVEREVPAAPVLADAAYGNDTQFREGITELGLRYVVRVHENMTVWRPGETPRPKHRRKGRRRPPTRLRRDAEHQPVAVKQLALS